MDVSLSTNSKLNWIKTKIDWPYELIFAQANVLPAKNVNPLERIILEIYHVFDEYLPSIEEAAVQLGIVEPAFLVKTLEQMLEKGFLEKDENAPMDFKHCRIKTDQSQQQENSGAVEKHGVRFCIDAVTSEHIPFVYFDLNDQPVQPVISVDRLPAKRQHLGLDKARQWASDQDEPFIGQTGHVSDITILPERSKFNWQSMPVELAIDSQGQLICYLETGTAAQQQWLDEQNVKDKFFSQMRTVAVEDNLFTSQLKTSGFAVWRNDVEHLVPPQELLKKVTDSILTAKNSLFIHGFWLGIESVRNIFFRSKCPKRIIFASNSVLNQIPGISNEKISKVTLEEACGLSAKVLLLADSEKGISLDKLSLKTSAGRQLEVIVPSMLKQESVVGFISELNLY